MIATIILIHGRGVNGTALKTGISFLQSKATHGKK